MRNRPRSLVAMFTGAVVVFGAAAAAMPPVTAVPTGMAAAPGTDPGGPLPRSPELTETARLDDRRGVVIGERLYSTGTEDGLYPALGFHTRGEMGGIWSPPVKLLDGMWFGVEDAWLGDQVAARRFASGWGYTRTEYAAIDGVSVHRTDVVPDGPRAGLVGLTLRTDTTRAVALTLDAHSELMSSYPWGETVPSQTEVNAADSGSVGAGRWCSASRRGQTTRSVRTTGPPS